MKYVFIILALMIILFPFSAFAQPAEATLGKYKDGSMPVWALDTSGFNYSGYAVSEVPSGYSYTSESVSVCLYPVVPFYGSEYSYASTSSVMPDSVSFNTDDILYLTNNPNSRHNATVLSPCIPGKAFNLVPGGNDPDSCAILHPESGGLLETAANVLSSVLPQTPEQFRIPTILANLGGQGSLAGNLALELYSGIWQYILIIVSIKFYQLIPGKFT